MSIYVQSNQIISELRCHRNLLTSSKAVPLYLKQVLVVRTSVIQISDTRISFLTILRFLCVIFFIIFHDFNPSVWHTQRMTNFVKIFLWRFFAPMWHSLSRPHTARFCLRFPMIIYDRLRFPRQSCSVRVSMMSHAAIAPDFRQS